MKKVFADTLYWIAAVRPRNEYKSPARSARESVSDNMLVTTDEVLTNDVHFAQDGFQILIKKPG